jgi:2-polyprenyl-3-methyl-5-hydroxy-6-metoxy-1,4-benzoquinol methylase
LRFLDARRSVAAVDDMYGSGWDEHYRSHAHPGSNGEPKGVLLAEIAGLTPGRALDVGCGSGADAIWLASQGWQVMAIDISETALRRAAIAAAAAQVTVDWVRADISASGPTPGRFNLVTMLYPALRHRRDDAAIRSLVDAVAPGGTILVVGHAPESYEYARTHGLDPANYIEPADVAAHLDDSWSIEVNGTRRRATTQEPGSPFSHDIVLRARRRL